MHHSEPATLRTRTEATNPKAKADENLSSTIPKGYPIYGNVSPFKGHSNEFNRQVGLQSIRRKEKEVQALQKALNLPETPSLLKLSHSRPLDTEIPELSQQEYSHYHNVSLSHKRAQNFDSRYSYDVDLLHLSASQYERQPLYSAGPLNSTLKGVNDKTEDHDFVEHSTYREIHVPEEFNRSVHVPLLQPNLVWNPLNPREPSTSQYEPSDRTLSTAWKDDHRRTILLDKIKNAHVVIQSQSEKLALSENEIMRLQGQLKSMEINKKVYQKDLEALQLEQQDMERVKIDGASFSHSLLARIKLLEREFRSLSITHDSLLLESKKRESVLDQTSLRLNMLEQYNKNLQERNDELNNKCIVTQQSKREAEIVQHRLVQEKQTALGEAAKSAQEYERVTLENNSLKSKNMDLVKEVKQRKSKTSQMEQELSELKMTREFETSKLDLVEEEVTQLQDTCHSLRGDKEQLLKDKLALERDMHKIGQENASLQMINNLLKGEAQRQEEHKIYLEEETRTRKKELRHCKTEGEREKERFTTEKNDFKEKLKTAKDNLERERRTLREKLYDEKENYKQEIEQAKESARRLSEENKRLERRSWDLDKQLQASRLSNSFSDGESFCNGATAADAQADGRRTSFEQKRRIEQLLVEISTYTSSLQQLQRTLLSVEEENRKMKQENEENIELLKLTETEKAILEKEQSAASIRLQVENNELKERIQDAWEQIGALNEKAEEQTEAMKRLLDVSKDTRKTASEANIMGESKRTETERNQMTRKTEECASLREQMDVTQEECQRLMSDNRRLTSELEDATQAKDQLEKNLADLANNNETLSSQIQKVKQEQDNRSVKNLQEELKHIRSILSRLDAEKSELMSELEALRQEKILWCEQKAELLMTQAELEAENREVAQDLKQAKAAEHISSGDQGKCTKTNKKDDCLDTEMATEDAAKELQVVRTELDKVWTMLRNKDDQLESQTKELNSRQSQLKKLAEEATQLKKNFAEMATMTSSRNQVITILRDQLMNKTNENAELHQQLASDNEQAELLKAKYEKLQHDASQSNASVSNWLNSERRALQAERDILKVKNIELEYRLKENTTKDINVDRQSEFTPSQLDLTIRRRSDGSLKRRVAPQLGGVSKDVEDELRILNQKNSRLHSRLEELFVERDGALQDSQDLREGMQQLKEAFEDEIERELELERERFEDERKQLMQEREKIISNNGISPDVAEMQDELKQLREDKNTFETKRKNLEFERDELRKQIEELCENRARSEEKGIQVDLSSTPSPKQRFRKRSASMGFITPIITVEEVPNGSPESTPRAYSPRRRGSVGAVQSSYSPPPT